MNHTYRPSNIFAYKDFTTSKLSQTHSSVKVKSPFLGEWNFQISIPFNELNAKLNTYCQNELNIQDIFNNLTPLEREKFLSDPSISNL